MLYLLKTINKDGDKQLYLDLIKKYNPSSTFAINKKAKDDKLKQ